MEKEKLLNALSHTSFKKADSLSSKQLSNSVKYIAKAIKGVKEGDLLYILDTSFLGNGKEGYAFTERFFCSSFDDGIINLDTVESWERSKKKKEVIFHMKDGSAQKFGIDKSDWDKIDSVWTHILFFRDQVDRLAAGTYNGVPRPTPQRVTAPSPLPAASEVKAETHQKPAEDPPRWMIHIPLKMLEEDC